MCQAVRASQLPYGPIPGSSATFPGLPLPGRLFEARRSALEKKELPFLLGARLIGFWTLSLPPSLPNLMAIPG